MAEALLSCDDVSFSYQGVRAVDHCSLAIPKGSITALIGPNGAGKSTLLSVLAGSLKPKEGRIHFNGRDITGWPGHRLARLGLFRTFQLGSEFPRLTVVENMMVAAQNQPGEQIWDALFSRRNWAEIEAANYDKAIGLLERFELIALKDEYAGALSGGQKRLLELARSLMGDPLILLLDEPLVGVNPVLAGRLIEHLRALNQEGLTCVVVEHELEFVERLSDRVLVMALGRVIAEGTMETLREDEQVVEAYLS